MAFLYVENLNFAYAGETKPALTDIDLQVEKGEFLLLCGPSGCGKTTLLRHLKPQLEPKGKRSGNVFLNAVETNRLPAKEAASKIGMIMQNPENQIVAETVRHELAFGLECLGVHPAVITKRIAETVSYFGIEHLYNKKTAELSGGEKQMVSIAAIMAMRPDLLLLDEPASQLDPIAARNLYDILLRLNTELGITVIITEHRIEDIFSVAHRVAVMNNGKLICADLPGKTAAFMAKHEDKSIAEMLPVPSKLYKEIIEMVNRANPAEQASENDEIPVTVREVKPWFETLAAKRINIEAVRLQESENDKVAGNGSSSRDLRNKETPLIAMNSVCFRFDKNGEDVINNLSLQILRGELLSIVGGNGAGKTTLLRLACGIIKPYSGDVKISNKNLKISYLPQNPQSMFAYDTVLDDLLSVEGEINGGTRFLRTTGIAPGKTTDISKKLQSIIKKLGIEDILNQHPYDLSVGELQRAALGMLLLKTPEVLLLDEPTKGIDKLAKKKTAELLKLLCNEGMTVVAVTHDIEFSAEYSNACAMLFDGRIINMESPAIFFSGNMCYTTVAHRIAGNIFKQTVTVEEVKNKWTEFAKEN